MRCAHLSHFAPCTRVLFVRHRVVIVLSICSIAFPLRCSCATYAKPIVKLPYAILRGVYSIPPMVSRCAHGFRRQCEASQNFRWSILRSFVPQPCYRTSCSFTVLKLGSGSFDSDSHSSGAPGQPAQRLASQCRGPAMVYPHYSCVVRKRSARDADDH
ncbi:hypothetical protein OBBRIDRAFT_41685 [Obba rivulosa]|uniref:Uncharacterized protein n=1 Tax=Obba rivulosa TaxID=1052685 RepID=A0A8E2AVF2_9APHY|nr:hypothetical protein OBBRIDRAFT_41685 [Obba rivulosa]